MKKKKLLNLIKSAKAEYSDDNIIIAIPEIIAKKFIGYCSMREDILLIIEYLNGLSKGQSSTISSALTHAIIVLYGKCFTDASEAKYPKLEDNVIFNDQPEYKALHDFLMNLRHRFIAHRGETDSEVGAAFLMFPKEGKGETQVKYKQLKQCSLNAKEIASIKTLAEFLLEVVEKRIQKAGDKAHRGMFKNFSLNELQIMTLNNMK